MREAQPIHIETLAGNGALAEPVMSFAKHS